MSLLQESTILVVDDNKFDQELAASVLTRSGAQVVFASNGQQALDQMDSAMPDLVLTDLQMPEMDGFELVQYLCEHYPFVPSVLMTAFGSEDIAVAALKHGAASYVRKDDLLHKLNNSIRDVLAGSSSHREELKVRRCWGSTEFQFSLDNDDALIPVLVNHLQSYACGMGASTPTDHYRTCVALHEALRNAMEHGNLELNSDLRLVDDGAAYYGLAEERRQSVPYADRRVHVNVRQTLTESRYQVRDEGPGFDPSARNYDPDDAASISSPSGRGLFLIHTFMDEVHFNPTGNEITMIRRREPAAVGASLADLTP